jgi:hypothetical protein
LGRLCEASGYSALNNGERQFAARRLAPQTIWIPHPLVNGRVTTLADPLLPLEILPSECYTELTDLQFIDSASQDAYSTYFHHEGTQNWAVNAL